jgi:hypothetical protein
VLSNDDKRKLYDEFGVEGLRGDFDPEQARERSCTSSRSIGRASRLSCACGRS